jgi:hypothetical protein
VRTRDNADEINELPPPPAPTARDANPWPVTGVPQAPPRLPSLRTSRARDPGTRKAREGMRNLVALGIVAFILVSGVFEALRGGGAESVVGLAFPLLILAIVFRSRRRKSRERDRAAAGRVTGRD